MKTVKLIDTLENPLLRREIAARIKHGLILIYPTDTVYGIGCNAMDSETVLSLRSLKSTDHPFSVVAPSTEWIKQNFETAFPEYLDMLPGPVTLILRQKRPLLPEEVSGSDRIGIRIPDHPFTSVLQESGVPVITTSANISGQKTITEIKEIPESFRASVGVAVDGGRIEGKPSKIIDLTSNEPRIIRE